TMGQALSDTIIEAFSASGQRVVGGRLAPAPLGSAARALALPDGSTVTTGAWHSGDLAAARRISGAPEIIAATTEVPTGRAVRAMLPAARALLRMKALRLFAARRLAAVRFEERAMPRPSTWGHASAEWSDGRTQEAWLRAG